MIRVSGVSVMQVCLKGKKKKREGDHVLQGDGESYECAVCLCYISQFYSQSKRYTISVPQTQFMNLLTS